MLLRSTAGHRSPPQRPRSHVRLGFSCLGRGDHCHRRTQPDRGVGGRSVPDPADVPVVRAASLESAGRRSRGDRRTHHLSRWRRSHHERSDRVVRARFDNRVRLGRRVGIRDPARPPGSYPQAVGRCVLPECGRRGRQRRGCADLYLRRQRPRSCCKESPPESRPGDAVPHSHREPGLRRSLIRLRATRRRAVARGLVLRGTRSGGGGQPDQRPAMDCHASRRHRGIHYERTADPRECPEGQH